MDTKKFSKILIFSALVIACFSLIFFALNSRSKEVVSVSESNEESLSPEVEALNVKILVGYHKPAAIIKDRDTFIPIHLGRALNPEIAARASFSKQADQTNLEIKKKNYQWLVENVMGDDMGDNISDRNRRYCELTGIYWAWKNLDKLGNPDYIGLNHYRRQFAFDFPENYPKDDFASEYKTELLDDRYQKDFGMNSKKVKKAIAPYDIIIPEGEDTKKIWNCENVYDEFKQDHDIKDLILCLRF